ncbi:PAS domain S-box protein [Inhella crocodyli]|uniref:PAS domain S-box protein n=2 Tax=Inhella crocodyli TaxID=2499851 RepID=A0A3S2UUL4_9BURK|nr:PAS domain S-box protein [Inhella crocodyli]
MDSAAEREFDALVAIASAVCNTPISLISLVDDRRQWFKANVGLPGVTETPREVAFCAHAIQGDALFEVPDATQDARFADNPLVTGQPDIRFYAGEPLRLSNGARVGTLCVIDRSPRVLDEHQRTVLRHLSVAAVQALEGRHALRALQRAREALRAAESRFGGLTQVAPVGVFAADAQGRAIYTNARWRSIYGLSDDQALGDGWASTLHPDDRDTVFAAWRDAVAARRELDLSFRIQRPDGNLRRVHCRARGLRGEDGELSGYVGSVEDVTDRSLSADALLDLLQSQFIVTVTDLKGTILQASPAAAAISGYTVQELVGAPHNIVNAGVHPKEFFQGMYDTLQAGRTWRSEKCNRRKDGSIYWVDAVLAPLPGLDGRTERYVSIATDITARKAQEAALGRLQALLEQTGEVAGVGGWELEIGAAGPVWTDQTCRIHGVPPGHRPSLEEALDFYAPEAKPVISEAVARALATGGGWDLELPVIRRDGRRIWARAVGHVEMRDGQAVRLMGAFQDITEKRRQADELRGAHQRMRLAAESGGIGIWDFEVATSTLTWDAQMHRLYDSPNDGRPLGHADWRDRIHPEDVGRAEADLARAHATGEPFDSEFRVVWRDGSVHHMRATALIEKDATGRPLRTVGVNWDVTPLREMAAQLAEQHELLHVTLESIGDAVITTDQAAKVTWLNPVAERLTGWPKAEASGRHLDEVFQIVNEATRLPAKNPVLTCLSEGKIVGLANHTVLLARDGQEYGIEDSAAPIRRPGGEVLGAVLVFHDVTEQRRMSGEMSYRATHDPLTDLFNRTELDQRLRALLHAAHADGSQHALLYIDLDQFKVVNDTCGHSAGDELLQQVAKLMQRCVRSRDVLARLGGDEFGVLLEQCTTEQAMRVAQKICDEMELFRFARGDQRFRVGASIGLVPVDRRFATPALVMQAADAACYSAKESGRNRVHEWVETDANLAHRHAEMQWSTRLEQALDDDAFVLFGQRIVSLTEADVGLHAELLLRLPDGRGGYHPPGLFLPAAERYHLASRIDRWVLRQVIDCLQRSPDRERLGLLSINLSGQSVGDRAFHAHALALLREAGASICERLCLEITETAAVTNMTDASQFVRQVRELGVRVALDDFGAGASSFGYLKQLQVDFLKIDGQFVKDVIDDPLDAVAVRSFVEVAAVVGVRTVAEFVDRAEVMARVREMGVGHAQGFHLHKPEPLTQLMATYRT